jgi:hypothetical protein
MDGTAMADLKLPGRPWVLARRGRDREGEGEGERGARLGGHGGGCRRGAQPVAPLFGLFSHCSREEENTREEGEEKREKRKEEGNEKRKGKKWKKIPNMEIFGKKNKR